MLRKFGLARVLRETAHVILKEKTWESSKYDGYDAELVDARK